jgi:hypothetical protein
MRVKSFLYPVAFGVDCEGDDNSCALRAYAYATDTSFKDTQAIFERKGRERYKGTVNTISHEAALEAGLLCMGRFGNGAKKDNFSYWCQKDKSVHERYVPDQKGMTLKTFCEKFNKGKYMVSIAGHMTVVHDGKIVDSFAQRGNAAVITAYKKP